MKPVVLSLVAGALMSLSGMLGGRAARAQEREAPTFKGGVDLVTVSVVVNNQNGRPITGLSREDFQLFDAGRLRAITEFRSELAPISIAVLLDASGSMRIAPKWPAARDVVTKLVEAVDPGRDRIALFTFDTTLHEVQPFTTAPIEVMRRLEVVEPFGSTALYDAIAQTGQRLSELGESRCAVVVVTDGVDNRSRLRAADVSAIASAIDMPVYGLVVDPPVEPYGAGREPSFGDLSRWTGGAIFAASAPTQSAAAVRGLVTELRHQYLMTFESSAPEGWHPLLVRVQGGTFVVRTRGGYIAGPHANGRD